MRRIWIRSACLVAAIAMVAVPSTLAQGKGELNPNSVPVMSRTAGGPDAFGYTFFDEAEAECTPGFNDISGSGTMVTFTASGIFPADDDGGAAITLMEPFEFYGNMTSDVVMSSNGYIAFGGGLAVDSGGDFSNDCPLPAVPDNPPSTPLRAMPFHDDLTGNGTGTAFTEYFPSCPRMGESGGDESCTIFQWTGWGFFANADTFTFQVILYHQSFEVAYEIQPGDTGNGASAAVAIQNLAGDDALTFQCDAGMVTAPKTICFFEPRFPPGSLAGGDLPIPTTNTWGMIILGGLLALGAMFAMRRRRQTV